MESLSGNHAHGFDKLTMSGESSPLTLSLSKGEPPKCTVVG